jgi:hypothetical protein
MWRDGAYEEQQVLRGEGRSSSVKTPAWAIRWYSSTVNNRRVN